MEYNVTFEKLYLHLLVDKVYGFHNPQVWEVLFNLTWKSLGQSDEIKSVILAQARQVRTEIPTDSGPLFVESPYLIAFIICLYCEKFNKIEPRGWETYSSATITSSELKRCFRFKESLPLPAEFFPGDSFNTDNIYNNMWDGAPFPADSITIAASDWTKLKKTAGLAVNGESKQQSPRRPPGRRGEITQKEASLLCHVSERLIQKWEAGDNTPEGYPGRHDAMVFRIWANSYDGKKRLEKTVKSMNMAVSVDPKIIEECHTESAFADADEGDNRSLEDLIEEQNRDMGRSGGKTKRG